MPTKKSGYENLKEKSARGEYTLVAPLDYILLGYLPEEGTMFAGLYPLGESAKAIHAKLPKEAQKVFKAPAVAVRFRVMAQQGLVVGVVSGVPSAGKHIWQRTKTGTKVLNEWKGVNGGSRG